LLLQVVVEVVMEEAVVQEDIEPLRVSPYLPKHTLSQLAAAAQLAQPAPTVVLVMFLYFPL
jgi:hypothetical protein